MLNLFSTYDFSKHICEYVKKNYVQTNECWTKIRKNKFSINKITPTWQDACPQANESTFFS